MKTGLVILAIATAIPVGAAAQSPTAPSRFEPGACAVEVAADERIDCGMLIVPENRGVPGSRKIRLPVLIFRSRSSEAAPDPVIFLNGGPATAR